MSELIFLHFGANASSTFELTCVETLIFRAKRHRDDLVQNLILYFSYPYTCHPYSEPFWRKIGKYAESYPSKGGFPPKKGGCTPFTEGNSLDLCNMTLEEYFCQI